MQQITKNVYVETNLRGANHGFVVTSEGVVVIDTPFKPTDTLELRRSLQPFGRLAYVINTEPHGDHWTGNSFLDAPVIGHEGVRKRILDTNIDEHITKVANLGSSEIEFLKGYRPVPPSITFSHRMTLHLGAHTFQLIHMPGHTPYQAAVVIEEERVAFTSDNIFSGVLTWMNDPGIDLVGWVRTLDSVRRLDVDLLVPGHGPICSKDYLDEQEAAVREWYERVRDAVDRGLSSEEAVEEMSSMADRYPPDVGHENNALRIIGMNVANLFRYVREGGSI
jgi:glyoxylase-like metal-dependent hydrolase (beta-lactamase superfamily II)